MNQIELIMWLCKCYMIVNIIWFIWKVNWFKNTNFLFETVHMTQINMNQIDVKQINMNQIDINQINMNQIKYWPVYIYNVYLHTCSWYRTYVCVCTYVCMWGQTVLCFSNCPFEFTFWYQLINSNQELKCMD